jgi:hypothetical protein
MDWIPVTSILVAILFTSWVLITSARINAALAKLTQTDDLLEDIGEDIQAVVTILQKLPELMPQYHVNQGNGIAEMLIKKIFNVDESLQTVLAPPRGPDGKFDGPKKE